MHEGGSDKELDGMLVRLSPCDLVLVEGFKREAFSKLECEGEIASDQPPVRNTHPGIVAVANMAEDEACALPQFRRDDIAGIAAFIRTHTGLTE